MSVPDRLKALAKIHDERAKTYNDDYRHLGKSLAAMFPNGLTLKSAEEFNRFALFVNLHGKVARYAQSMLKGGHADSCDDIAVYSQLIRKCDDEGVDS